MWRLVKCCVSQPPSWSKPVSGVVGVGLARPEVRLVAVDLDRDLQLWVREVDAEPPRGDDDLVLPHRLGQTSPSEQLHHLGLEVALGRGRHVHGSSSTARKRLHAAPALPAHLVDVRPQRARRS